MQHVTFNTMPEAIQLIADRLENVERLLTASHEPQPQQQPAKDLLTIQEAAEMLCLSVPTLYAKVSKRQLPFMKRSKRLYFSRAELLTYLKKGRTLTIDEVQKAASNHVGLNRKGLNDGK